MAWTLPTTLSDQFALDLREYSFPDVLELGTLRWEKNSPTHHKVWHAEANWVLSDLTKGPDVDVAADAHDLKEFADDSFDALVACSLLEHLARPWIAVQAMARVLRPGGIMYLATHQSFPLHGYPHDYFRFSTMAMEILADDAGLEVVGSAHVFPCKIVPQIRVPVWNEAAEAYLNVELYARKP